MSYNFYSLVSSIKDKSSQALNTLSSDLKEFSSIIQEVRLTGSFTAQ